MMGTEKPAQIICHLLELLKDNRRLPAPPDCPTEVRAPLGWWGILGRSWGATLLPSWPRPLSPGLRADAELLGFRSRPQTHLWGAGP